MRGGGVRGERTFQVKIRFCLIDTLPNMCEVLGGFYKKIPLSFMEGGGCIEAELSPIKKCNPSSEQGP